MKIKKNLKRFFTLSRSNEGFTLVELIVVIAILAILAGVAVPAYSGYITKTNMTKDITLASEVENALTLGFYDRTLKGNGYVVLSSNSAPKIGGEGVDESLKAAFGDTYADTMRLTYTEWNSEYSGSSFAGNETALMGQVEGLTGALGEVLANNPGIMGDNFKDYMTGDLGFSEDDIADSDKAADAAVMYVANGTANLTEEQQQQMITVVSTSGGDINRIFDGMITVYDGNIAKGAAVTYAMFVGYCQYQDQLNGNNNMMTALGTPDTSSIVNGDKTEMTNMLLASLDRVGEFVDEEDYQNYWTNVAAGDVSAFVNAMSTVNGAQSQIAPNLGTDGCFTSTELTELFNLYGQGGVIILVEILADGSLQITNPLAS